MINATSLSHPKIQKKIRREFWLLKMQSIKTKQRATGYIKNRHGNNCLRLDVHPSGELVVFAAGMGMRNYVSVVLPIVEGI